MRHLLLSLAACGLVTTAEAATVTMSTKLVGAAEIPGPGADKGTGSAEFMFDSDKGQVCYTLTTAGTDAPTMAHIHKGAAGTAGPVVVPLAAPVDGSVKACAPVSADLMGAISASPADYYVNVHTAAFPKGAMRGQLGR